MGEPSDPAGQGVHRAPAVARIAERDLRDLQAQAIALAEALAWFADRAAENARRSPHAEDAS